MCGVLLLWGIIIYSSDKDGQTLGTAQSEVGAVLIGILGIALLWKGSMVKEIPRHLHTD